MMHIAETRDIATCRALRRIVFIEEQGVSEADELTRDRSADLARAGNAALVTAQREALGFPLLPKAAERDVELAVEFGDAVAADGVDLVGREIGGRGAHAAIVQFGRRARNARQCSSRRLRRGILRRQ